MLATIVVPSGRIVISSAVPIPPMKLKEAVPTKGSERSSRRTSGAVLFDAQPARPINNESTNALRYRIPRSFSLF
jgi:hypothetical protein